MLNRILEPFNDLNHPLFLILQISLTYYLDSFAFPCSLTVKEASARANGNSQNPCAAVPGFNVPIYYFAYVNPFRQYTVI